MPSIYAAWPTPAHVQQRLRDAGVRLRDTVTADRIQQTLDAVTTEVGTRTQRQFVAATGTRLFDGTGTSELQTDELVSVTSVTVLGYQTDPGYSLADVELVYEQERPRTRLILGKGSAPALSGQGIYGLLQRTFPAGRQNIQIVGSWGYAALIPADLWEAVAVETAARLAEEAIYTPNYDADTAVHLGRVASITNEGIGERYELVPVGEGLRWTRLFAAALKRYRRPPGRALRKARPQMI